MGPKILMPEEISRYVDGELSESERRDIEFQVESFAGSREKLDAHKAVADQIATLYQEMIFNDPAYRSFVRLVENFEPRSIDMDIQAIRKLIPDRDRLRRILEELASDLTGSVPEVSMSMMSLERAPSKSADMDSFAVSEPSLDVVRVAAELARHLNEFAGVNGLFIQAIPQCTRLLRQLENTVMTLRKIDPNEAEPEIAMATVCIEHLAAQGLPGARIMLKIIQGKSVFKRDYQMVLNELNLFIKSNDLMLR